MHASETYSVQPYAHYGRVFEECGAHETSTGRNEEKAGDWHAGVN